MLMVGVVFARGVCKVFRLWKNPWQSQSCLVLSWEDSGWRDFRRQRSGFSLGHVDFEVSIKHPDGDAEAAVGFKRMEFKENSESISLGWRYNFGSHGCRDRTEVKEVDEIT